MYARLTKKSSMTLNATHSPLLALPPEIRNKILAYAVGGYDIYIGAYNAQSTWRHLVVANVTVVCKHVQLSYRMVTVMLPQGTRPFRPARPTDTLPATSLARVCRQLYAETGLLPYRLNHFKFSDSRDMLRKNVGKYTNWNQYNAFDLWLQHRLPVQMRALASLAPMAHYIERYYWKKRPAFTSLFPGLRVLDLGLQFRSEDEGEDGKWRAEARKRDVESGFRVVFPKVSERDVWGGGGREHYDYEVARLMMTGPCHFEAEVEAKLE